MAALQPNPTHVNEQSSLCDDDDDSLPSFLAPITFLTIFFAAASTLLSSLKSINNADFSRFNLPPSHRLWSHMAASMTTGCMYARPDQQHVDILK